MGGNAVHLHRKPGSSGLEIEPAPVQEGRLLASLRHPYIVRYRESFCEAFGGIVV